MDDEKNGEKRKSLTKTIVIGFIEALGLILWQFADGFSGWLRVLLHWFSISCFIMGLSPVLSDALTKRWYAYCICAGFSIITLPFVYLCFRPPEIHSPHFSLSLSRTSQSPYVGLPLTNESLIFKNESLSIDEEGAYVVVAVPNGTSNVSLTFSVQNDSSSATIEAANIQVNIPTNSRCVFNPAWSSMIPNPPDADYRGFRLPELTHGSGQELPSITFPADNNRHYPVAFRTQAKEMKDQFWGFWVACINIPTNIMHANPQVVRGKKVIGSGKIEFAIQAEAKF